MKNVLFIILLLVGSTRSLQAQIAKKHIVSKGDTVYSIAKRYGTTTEAIFKLNPSSVDGIGIGSTLLIPGKGVETPKTVTPKVKKELGNVAKPKQNVEGEVEELLKGLDNVEDLISEKHQLRFKTHKVRRKETLYSISKKYKVTIDDLKKFNKRLYSEELRKGDKLKVPIFSEDYYKNKIKGSSRLSTTTKYVIKPQDTKFGIARRHGITVAQLESINPEMGDILSIGQQITVPTAILVKYDEEKDPRFRLYEIKPKETVYSLTKALKISEDSLNVLNPFLKVDGLKAGMILRLPKSSNLDSLAIDYVGDLKINLEDRLSNFAPKRLALMLPFNLDKLGLDDPEATETLMKKDRVLRISLDFYAGALLAVEQAKKKGITTDISVYDTQNDKGKILEHIKKNNFDDLDAVIGPLYQKNIETVASELKKYQTPVFSPISNKESKLYNNFFQTMPSAAMLEDKLINYMLRDTLPKNVIIIADAKHEAIKLKLKEKFPKAKIVTPQKENFIYEADIIDVLEEGVRNWVFVESSSIPLISNITPYLNARHESHQITLFTTDKNDAYDNESIQNSHLSKLEFHYPSIDKEFDDASKSTFLKMYKNKYGTIPTRYAIRGFDIIYDILLRLASADDLYHAATFEGTTEYVENKFNYGKKSMGGYYNKAAYLIKYTKDLKLVIVD